MINSFEGEYHFLSNFFDSKIVIDEKEYKTVEHYFQAMKMVDPVYSEMIRIQLKPGIAKAFGRKFPKKENWNEIRDEVMLKGLRAKFSQNLDLKEKLIKTGDSILIEGNTWHDVYWGKDINTSKGLNKLGILLMQVREEMKSNSC